MTYYLPSIVLLLFVFYMFGKKNERFRQGLIVLFLLLNFIYVVWRSVYTLPTLGIINITAGLLLLITEWAGFVQSFVLGLLFWKKFDREKIPLTNFSSLPTIDVFIATYNESIPLLKRIIVACQSMDYPDKSLVKVYVCDDGRREEVRVLCEETGAAHVTRPTNEHAKAGNLNHAMSVSNGDLIVTLDADMVPRANFLEETVGFFTKDNVAFVQAPQAFFNADPFQFNLFAEERITNEQDFFMQHLEKQRDRFNAAMYVGSNSLFRRRALEEIGGFATGVITEDMATGMLIQARGWQTVFVSKVLAVGLAPETFADLLKQRDRWCRGTIQVARKWNPLTTKGLSFMQKLLYLNGVNYWFFGIYQIVILMAPILYLVFGIYSLRADFNQLLLFWLPYYASSYLLHTLIFEKKRTNVWSSIYEIAQAPTIAWAVLSELFLNKKINFHVTRKGIQTNQRQFLWRAGLFHIFLLALALVGIVRSFVTFIAPNSTSLELNSLYINTFWLLYSIVTVSVGLLVFFERPRYRFAERFVVNQPAAIQSLSNSSIPAQLVDLNETGGKLVVEKTELQEQPTSFQLNIADKVTLPCTVRWMNPTTNYIEMGISFDHVPLDDYRYIIDLIYSKPLTLSETQRYKSSSLLVTFASFVGKSKKEPSAHKRLFVREQRRSIGLVGMAGQYHPISIVDISPQGCQIKTKVKLRSQDQVSIIVPSESIQSENAQVRWIKRRFGYTYAGILLPLD